MTSLLAETWSSYRIVPPLSGVISSSTLHCTLAACVTCVSAFCSSLPLVFFSFGMYQTAPEGLQDMEESTGETPRTKGKDFSLKPIRLELVQLWQGFTQQGLAVVLMVQCDYWHVEKRVWEIMWLSKCWNEHTPLTVLWLVSQCRAVASIGMTSDHDFRGPRLKRTHKNSSKMRNYVRGPEESYLSWSNLSPCSFW